MGCHQRTAFWFVYPYSHKEDAPDGEASFNLSEEDPTGLNVGVALGPSGEEVPPLKTGLRRLEARLKRPAGVATLAELLAAVGSAAGCEVRGEPYARERRVLALADGARGDDVLGGLGLLWAWEVREEKAGRYYLGRRRLATAASSGELIAKLQAALPPTIRLLYSHEGTFSNMRGVRYHTQRFLIMGKLEKALGRGWKRANLAGMPASLQQEVANWILDFHIYPHWSEIQQMGWWLVEPEKGYFTLEGELGPGKNPLLSFSARRPDGKVNSWGYFANTSSGR
jgi:hypothetical protein